MWPRRAGCIVGNGCGKALGLGKPTTKKPQSD